MTDLRIRPVALRIRPVHTGMPTTSLPTFKGARMSFILYHDIPLHGRINCDEIEFVRMKDRQYIGVTASQTF